MPKRDGMGGISRSRDTGGGRSPSMKGSLLPRLPSLLLALGLTGLSWLIGDRDRHLTVWPSGLHSREALLLCRLLDDHGRDWESDMASMLGEDVWRSGGGALGLASATVRLLYVGRADEESSLMTSSMSRLSCS